ncbi:APC family permease [Marinitenerispora sediminis]|uniref:Amino acid permease n=1 Tax=Marinitenerispora sediminis TaxID=1931232 RepID=A0A368SZS1_9ACTN|nr:APC family permease [Marinitenerispora sediminis]RCV48060.1 amino acid permease [Marinitenerispora sediminis]RCV49147.1 amino acid permease [Marinitenerispora sediminis]RCV51398.1 amino acid permease [Marinitenerispora sediminis]
MTGTTGQGAAAPAGHPELRRAIGPGLLLLFVVGDMLGTGIYALSGQVAAEVGGAVWLPFLVAFLVAFLTACAYLELVTKYPRAAGAALYTHKAFGLHYLTFIVAFAVMCSGLTSSASAARAFAGNLDQAAGLGLGDSGALLPAVAAGLLLLIAAVNIRGVAEGVRLNVVLTCVELTGLVIILGAGALALARGMGDYSQLTAFGPPDGGSAFTGVTAAAALAFFALVGFEDSVNMAEEVRDPHRTFPRMLLLGITLTAVLYIAVATVSTLVVPLDRLSEGTTPLLQVLTTVAPAFPVSVFAVITMAAVSNTALLNMLMASRLLYGLANERVLPGFLGAVLRRWRTPWAAVLVSTGIALVLMASVDLAALAGTTSLLLLCVFTVVNVAVLVLRRDRVGHPHFRVPAAVPVLGAVACAFLASPLSGRDPAVYPVAGLLFAAGTLLWLPMWLLRRRAARSATAGGTAADAVGTGPAGTAGPERP